MVVVKKTALGRGLGSLLEGAESSPVVSAPASVTAINEIPISKISTNPFQPRTNFDVEALEELAESIREFGLIQPITVRKIGLSYQIISGERRFRASQIAGLETVPAYIKEADEHGMLEMAIVENIQREDLDPIEVALSFQRLIDECNLTQDSMAAKVGKNRATVANFLRLLRLPPVVQAALREGKISIGHAKCLLSLNDVSQQESLCRQIVAKGMSVRATEAKVRALLAEKPVREHTDAAQNPYSDKINRLKEISKASVNINKNAKGEVRVVLAFDREEALDEFLQNVEKL
ncbi:MAG: ParB/RepB/Spo0J family partition protein [Bacteroidales bacterium]|nr:ParB/RepB/Spo0J family partition protein [Bacteroidales bacterium]